MRVLPPPALTASNSVRSPKVSAGFIVWNTCDQCAPPSVDRHRPYPITAAYTAVAEFGSYAIFVMPPWNQSLPAAGGAGFGGVLPWRSVEIVKCAPPSVDV